MTNRKKVQLDTKGERGVTGVDLSVAILIIIIFVSIITTLFYNIYLSSSAIKRSSQANSYAIGIIEEIKKVKYEEIEDNSQTLTNILANQNIERGYTAEIAVTKYNETQGNQNKEDYVKTVTVTIRYQIGAKQEQISIEALKTKEVAYTDSAGVTPALLEGMIPVKYVTKSGAAAQGHWQITSSADPEWFSYEEKKWANVMLQDGLEYNKETGEVTKLGSMLVYIPRFAYQIPANQYHTTSNIGTVSIKFIDLGNSCYDGSNETIMKSVSSSEASVSVNATTNYIQHPAFTLGDKELEGIWVGKFETSMQDAGTTATSPGVSRKISIKPNVTSWRNLTITDAFNVCFQMRNNTTYGLSSSEALTHMMKNTEWGAVAYLTKSKYGVNSTIWNNNSSQYITGNCGSSSSAINGSAVTYRYDTVTGQRASTTGNIYGIYDIAGGAAEYTAGYLYQVTGNTYVTTFNGYDVNYVDRYQGTASSDIDSSCKTNFLANSVMYGDAIWERSNQYYNNYHVWYMTKTLPFTTRGSTFERANTNAINSMVRHSGASDAKTGFRVTIAQ